MDMKMNQVAKLDVVPSGRRIREVVPDGQEQGDDLGRLDSAGLLSLDGDRVSFHDLQRDYLLLHSPPPASLHADLLDAYRVLLPEPDRWWSLPAEEPYIWDHLAGHLVGAGALRTLVATVTEPAYVARRIALDGRRAAVDDLVTAARAVVDDPAVAWWQRWLERHEHTILARGRSTSDPAQRLDAITSLILDTAGTDPDRPDAVRMTELRPRTA